MTELNLPQATKTASYLFGLSRNVALYTPEECDRFLLLGLQYRAVVSDLVRKEFTRVTPTVVEDANQRLDQLADRLKEELDGIKNVADSVKQASDLLVILEKIAVLATGL
jgi:hypothetical protein